MNKKWLDNAFWEDKEEKVIKAILVITEDNGSETVQELTVAEKAYGGGINPDYTDLVEQIGIDKLDENTEKRAKEILEFQKDEEKRFEEQKKAKDLENLFESKLKAFEIDEIKKSKNRSLKTKLRRSKSNVEVNIYAMMIVMEELENESRED